MQTLLRFDLTGVLATLTHVVVFVVLVEQLQLAPLSAAAPAFLAAVGVSYAMNYHWTFGATGPHRVTLPKFFAVSASAFFLNLLITWLVADLWAFWYGYALLAVIIFIPIWTFLLSRFWVFQR